LPAEESKRMWEIVRAGGPFMWPIILCSVVAAAIILERLWTLQEQRVVPRDLIAAASDSWSRPNQINDKVIAALEQNSPLRQGSWAPALANRHRSPRGHDGAPGGRRPARGARAGALLQARSGTIAGISPLLGLLGTVTGIIKSFNAMQAGGGGSARMLSGGIAEALIATAAGLCVAIPALISYRYLRGRVETLRGGNGEGCHQARGRGRGRGPRECHSERDPDPAVRPVAVTGTWCAHEPAAAARGGPGDQPVVSLIDVVLLMVVFFMLSSSIPRRRPRSGSTCRRHVICRPRKPRHEPLVVCRDPAGRLPGQRARELINSSPGHAARCAAEGRPAPTAPGRVTLRADARSDPPVGDHGDGRACPAGFR
jgi:biopolymer transport protein ExbB